MGEVGSGGVQRGQGRKWLGRRIGWNSGGDSGRGGAGVEEMVGDRVEGR